VRTPRLFTIHGSVLSAICTPTKLHRHFTGLVGIGSLVRESIQAPQWRPKVAIWLRWRTQVGCCDGKGLAALLNCSSAHGEDADSLRQELVASGEMPRIGMGDSQSLWRLEQSCRRSLPCTFGLEA
jgi:hypothetical protein